MLLLLLSSALAAPAPAGVQVRTFIGAIDFAERYLEALDTDLYVDDLYGEVSCWDRVGIRPFALTIPVDTVDLTLDASTLGVSLRMGTIAGDDMVIYGEDAESLDACAAFETDLRTVRVYDGALDASLGVFETPDWLGGGDTVLAWVASPVLTGDLQTDIAWFPDELVLWFVEDTIWESASDAVADAVPPLATDLLAEAAYAGDYDGLGVSLELSALRITTDALEVEVDAEVGATSTVACEVGETGGAPSPGGRAPTLPFDRPEDSDLAVGLTEEMLAHLLHAGWESGALCFQPESLAELLDDLAPLVDGVGALEAWATLHAPPVLTVDEDRMTVRLDGLALVVTGTLDGDTVEVVRVTLDLEGELVPGFDQALTAVTGSLRDLELDITDLHLAHTVGGEGARPLIEREIEQWVADWTEEAFDGTVLLDSLYYAWDVAMLLERIAPREGGVELYFQLYDLDDPEVDTVAPDTSAEVVAVRRKEADLRFSGDDDRPDPLAWSWQVDGGGWSDFALEPEVTIGDLAAGEHTIEVVARDRWLNVDAEPAVVTVWIESSSASDGCGCASGPRGGSSWALLVALLVGVSRNRPVRKTAP